MSISAANGAILITGASKRIGREIAVTLAKKAPIVIHFNNSSVEAESLASEINNQGGQATFIKADLNNETDVASLIEQASNTAGKPITALINNASLFENETALTTTKTSFDKHMNINLWAPLKLTQDMAQALPQGTQGHVINLIDQRVLGASTNFTSYTLSKAALLAMTKNLALELAPNVQVNAVAPGPILQSIHQTEDEFKTEAQNVPLNQTATATDIAKAVQFLLDNKAITGEMITLDGGQHLL